MFFREASEGLLARRMVAQAQDGGFGERPRAVGMAELRARSAIAVASRCFRTRDEAAIGHARLEPGEAVDIVERIEPHQGQDRADPGDGAQAVEELCLMRFGGLDQRPLEVGQQGVVGLDPRAVDLKALVAGRLGEARRHAGAVRRVCELLADRREGVLPRGLLDRGPELGPCAREMHPAPEPVSGGTPLSRIDLGLREPAAAEPHRNRVGVERLVLGRAPRHGLHVQGVAQDEGQPRRRAKVREPGPR
jgi:hypothetical protein